MTTEKAQSGGSYPLHVAVFDQNLKVIEGLVCRLDDPNVKDPHGKTALTVALELAIKDTRAKDIHVLLDIIRLLVIKGVEYDASVYRSNKYIASKMKGFQQERRLAQADAERIAKKEEVVVPESDAKAKKKKNR